NPAPAPGSPKPHGLRDSPATAARLVHVAPGPNRTLRIPEKEKIAMSRTRSRTVRPRFDVLEDRTLLSVSASISAGTLTVTGTGAPEHVKLNDDGAGSVSVKGTGLSTQNFNGVDKIVINMNGGEDKVTYNLNGALSTARTINPNLGDKDDTFTANINGDLNANLTIDATGGGGDDVMTINSDNVNVAKGVTFEADMDGKGGKDTITTNYSGVLDGTLDLLNKGGDKKDTLKMILTALDGSTGKVGKNGDATAVEGNGAGDNLRLEGRGPAGVQVFAEARGNGGKDTCHRTANVTSSSVKTDFVVV